MNALIEYRSVYHYERAVSFAPHFVRIFPRSDTGARYRHLHFETNEGADVQMRRDVFDNEFALCFYPAWESRDLRFEARFEMELRERNPFHFLVAPHALEWPFRYESSEARFLAPFLVLEPSGTDLRLPFWPAPSAGDVTVDLVVNLTRTISENIEYERRESGPARTPEETVRAGRGACRDTCLLMAAVCRQMGIAARIVSGYLMTLKDNDPARLHTAEGAFHAWTEIYLPGAGWIGCDATNGVLCDHTFIPTAAGLTHEDVTPISGTYYNNEYVEALMETTLTVKEAGA